MVSKSFDRLCPLCVSKATIANNEYVCSCGHSEPVHIHTGRAQKEYIKHLRKQAHLYFDIIWRAKKALYPQVKGARTMAYKWLAKTIKMKPINCHFRTMPINKILEAINVCAPYYEKCINILSQNTL